MLSLILLFIVLVVTVKMMIIIIIINVVIITVISSLRYIEFLLHFPSLYLSKDKKNSLLLSHCLQYYFDPPPPYISFSLPIISYWISSLSGLLLTSFLLSLLLFFSLFLFVLLLLHSFLLTLSTSPS